MDLRDPKAFYYGMPVVTRLWFTVVVATTLVSALGLVPLGLLNLDWDAFLFRFHIWRLFTNVFFVGKLGLQFLFNVVWLVRFSSQLEKSPFPSADSFSASGTSGDYAWMLFLGTLFLGGMNGLFILTAVNGLGPVWLAKWAMSSGSLLGEALLFMVTFVWSRKFPNEQAGVWMVKTQAFYFPWLLLVFNLLLGGDATATLLGYLAGAVFVLLADTLPAASREQWGSFAGAKVLFTPHFMYDLVQWAERGGAPAPGAGAARAGGFFGGAPRTVNG